MIVVVELLADDAGSGADDGVGLWVVGGRAAKDFNADGDFLDFGGAAGEGNFDDVREECAGSGMIPEAGALQDAGELLANGGISI